MRFKKSSLTCHKVGAKKSVIRLEFCRSLLEIVTSIFRHFYQTKSKFDVIFIFPTPFCRMMAPMRQWIFYGLGRLTFWPQSALGDFYLAKILIRYP